MKSVKLMGLFAMMAALLTSALLSGYSASAATLLPAPGTATGKLSIVASDASNGKMLAGATVLIVNDRAERVAKGLTNNTGVYEIKLYPGIYKVTVVANGHKEYGQVTVLKASSVTVVKANLAK